MNLPDCSKSNAVIQMNILLDSFQFLSLLRLYIFLNLNGIPLYTSSIAEGDIFHFGDNSKETELQKRSLRFKDKLTGFDN
jgi:hypothetical protein